MLSTVCPNCRATFRLRDELRGRVLRCTRCSETFTAPTQDAPPPADVSVAAAPSVLPYRAPAMAPRVVDEPWSPGRLVLRKLGFQLAAFGVVTLILPLFGLQFTKLAKLGDAAWIAGAALIVVGAIMVGLAHAGRRAGMIALIVVPALILGGIGLILATSLMVRTSRPAPTAAVVTSPPPRTATRVPPVARATPPPGYLSAPPGAVRFAPASSSPVRTTNPASTQPAGTRGILARQFGEKRVLDVRVIGIADPRQRAAVQRKLNELMRRLTPGGPSRAISLIPPPPGLNGAAAFVVGPVDDPATLAGAVDFGTATVEAPNRMVTITVDPATLTPPTARPR